MNKKDGIILAGVLVSFALLGAFVLNKQKQNDAMWETKVNMIEADAERRGFAETYAVNAVSRAMAEQKRREAEARAKESEVNFDDLPPHLKAVYLNQMSRQADRDARKIQRQLDMATDAGIILSAEEVHDIMER